MFQQLQIFFHYVFNTFLCHLFLDFIDLLQNSLPLSTHNLLSLGFDLSGIF